MPSPRIAAILATIALAGCSVGSAYEALDIAPSQEITGSITPPAAVGGGGGSEPTPAAAAMNALAETKKPSSAVMELVAMVMPPKPTARPAAPRGTVYSPRFKDAHPIAFGKVTPDHHAVHGVDVSRWQREIDWETLRKRGANFAFIKATDGSDHLDPMFMKNWNGAKAAGIKRGAYHFFYWCSYASAQADWFIRNVPKDPDALPPVLDVEWNHQSSCPQNLPRDKVLAKMRVFLDRLERHYGKRPIIYTSPDFYADNLKGVFEDYPFWLRSTAEHPSEVYPDRDWVFWQYSGTGLSKGVETHIDLNVFRGDESDWHRWLARVSG